MMRITSCIRIVILSFVITTWFNVVSGFAYAPNFITKIIEEQTKITLQKEENPELQHEEKNGKRMQITVGDDEITNIHALVKTRFPPEPNGYLHLGHAKSISFNFAVARMFGGACNMRMDDTNPSKEDEEYVASILKDVLWVQEGLYEDRDVPWHGKVKKTSDYFDLIYNCAVALIQSGDAYVDSLSAEEMREYRGTLTEPGRDSPYRNRSIEENLQLFREMRDGKFPDGAHVLRAKIAMDSPNINMRDPTLYRIKHESHQETGDRWCIYPMYDFSHPIADAVEEITHSLCTLEFEDHRPFYDWTIEKLLPTGLIHCRPQQIEFSRLNIRSTVLSKRKLIQLVTGKHVLGWDDPRMPTLAGIRRRGMPPAALQLFCERIGISKADSNIDFSVLEDSVRETMDSTCPRAFAVLQPLKVTIENWEEGCMEEFQVDRHPKLEQMGKRTIPFGKTIYIERSDFFDTEGPEGENTHIPKGFKRLVPGGQVRLRYAYVIECTDIVRDPETQEPIELKCTYFPETRGGVTPNGMQRVNGIIHWVEASHAITCTINQYDRLFAAEEPGKDGGDFLKDINQNSLEILESVVIEPSVAYDAAEILDKIGEQSVSGPRLYPSALAYQFERSGYFALDKVSTKDRLTFNRVVTLRDTWGAQPAANSQTQRTRGGGRQPPAENKSTELVEDIRRISIVAATILSAELHPEAENLLVCKVDCGDKNDDGEDAEPRTVVAGLAGKVLVGDLVGKKVVAVTNLKPAKMRGIESTAMLLAASNGKEGDDEIVELLSVPASVPNGELVSFEGIRPSEPDAMLKSKGALKAWDRAKSGLKLNEDGEAVYIDENRVSHRMLSTSGTIKASTLSNTVIQ
jgi:glutaminyl-tRNA synthetase